MQFGIFVFVEAEEVNLEGSWQGSKCDRILHIHENFSLFYEKVPSPLDHAGFFRNRASLVIAFFTKFENHSYVL